MLIRLCCLIISLRLTQIEEAVEQLQSKSLASVVKGMDTIADFSEDEANKDILGAAGVCKGFYVVSNSFLCVQLFAQFSCG